MWPRHKIVWASTSAHSYQFSEQLPSFTNYNNKRKDDASELLDRLARKGDEGRAMRPLR